MKEHKLEDHLHEVETALDHEASGFVDDSLSRIDVIKESIGNAAEKAREGVVQGLGSRVSKLGEHYQKVKSDAVDRLNETMSSAKEGAGQGLSRFNMKAQAAADRLPGGIGHKAASYPWVSISLALGLGLLLSRAIRQPCRSDG